IVRANPAAVKLIWRCQHLLVDEPADDLTVFENERHFARTHFQHRPRTEAAGPRIAETGIEESGIMNAEFADQRIEWNHLRGIAGRHLDRFCGSQNVKLVRVKDQRPIGSPQDRLPEVSNLVGTAALDYDHCSVPLGAIADDAV